MLLVVAALVPAIVLIAYVYKMDRVEKEPRGLLIRLFLLGALSTLPALIVEIVLDLVLVQVVEPETFFYHLISSFVIVAGAEEFWKRVMTKTAWKHPAFNYRFDAVVYAVTAAMGFAALENILYVADSGFSLAVTRATTAVPSHAVDGAFMGFFLGEAKLCERRGDLQGKKKNMRLSLLVPMLCHGFYDFCLFRGTIISMLLFVVFVIAIDVAVILHIEKISREDTHLGGEISSDF